REYKNKPTIGKPIGNTAIYILGTAGDLLPVGAAGELCIAGDGVGRGYLNRPELTTERFVKYKKQNTRLIPLGKEEIKNTQSPQPQQERLYKTGDQARWLENGTIEFLGRMDHQVKVRGYRVETGEIETRLLKHPEVKETVVQLRIKKTPHGAGEAGRDEYYLCAYLAANEKLDIAALREYLAEELPDYMIPPFFVQLDAIPLTTNGKIDRGALPEPEMKTALDYVAPREHLEKELTALWAQILGTEKDHIGIDDDFFEIGGHSLKATMLLTKMHKKLEIKVPLLKIFKTPTIR
ncbi:MAG: AMP-binding protein, partial [bacterium]|nr:AMP-binding protein [bacterium]